jgi:Nitrile hydratase beta subunit
MQAEMEPTYDVRFRARDLWPDTSDEALNHVAVFQSYLEKAKVRNELTEQSIMSLQFIHVYAIELEGRVSSKRPHLRGDKPGGHCKKVLSLLRDGMDPH